MDIIRFLSPCLGGGSEGHTLFKSQQKRNASKKHRRNSKFDYLRRSSVASTARSSNNAKSSSSNFFSMPSKALKKIKRLFSGTGNQAVTSVAIGDLKYEKFDYVWSQLKTAHREALAKLEAEASANQAKRMSTSKTKASSSQNEIILEDEQMPVPICLTHRLVKGKTYFEWSKKSPSYQKDMAVQVMLNDLWKKKTGRHLKELFSKTALTLENIDKALTEHEAAIKTKITQPAQAILRNPSSALWKSLTLWKPLKKLRRKHTVGVVISRRA